MALKLLRTALLDKLEEDNTINTITEVTEFIDQYIEEEDEKYRKNKKNKALTFGRWKGFTVKELSVSDKGKSYLEWLLTQQWFSEDKFADIHEECKTLGIKKKITKRACLT